MVQAWDREWVLRLVPEWVLRLVPGWVHLLGQLVPESV